MLGAIYIGLSGMEAYSKGLQTISNNVANLNTLGFKSATVAFSDLYARGGGGLTYTNGAPSDQAGAGVVFAKSNIDFNQGTLQQTANDLDLALQGAGLLMLQDKSGNAFFARTGQFAVDANGFITERTSGYHLLVVNSANQAVPVNISAYRSSPPVATTTIGFTGNLSSSASTADVPNIAVFDSAGNKHVWDVSFAPAGSSAPGSWTVTVKDETGATVGTGVLSFTSGAVNASTAKITISTTPAGASPLAVTLDFSSGVSSFSAGTTSTLAAGNVDGNALGSLSKVTVDQNGLVTLSYSNSKTQTLGAVAIADFRDPQQLVRVGSGLFENINNAYFRVSTSNQNGVGQLVSKQLESSNVDLSAQFGELILVQRGFQAASQVVSVSNDMIQELFGLRGHG